MNYLFEYDGPVGGVLSRPRWVKEITDAEGVVHRTILNFENEDERANLTVAQMYQHMDNLVLYISHVANQISPVQVDDPLPTDGWHFNGNWSEAEWAKEECFKWWNVAYYADEEA